jgi:hypothetical protein
MTWSDGPKPYASPSPDVNEAGTESTISTVLKTTGESRLIFGVFFSWTSQKMPCGDGIWKKRNGQYGACNSCFPWPHVPEGIWDCKANGDISLDLKGKNAQTCTSWTTEGSCEFKQKDLRALQANLVSSGCDGIWAAPLWMVGKDWALPQSATGEIDFFERGCFPGTGYVLAFGGEDKNILKDAWGEQGKATAATALTAYMTFDPNIDSIDIYRCPLQSNPIEVGPEAALCTKTGTYTGYYRDTAVQTKNGEEYMRLVSNMWNGCDKLICGNKPKIKSSDCNFSVTGIQLQFSQESTASGKPFHNPICDPLWHKAKRASEES